jgi:orotate phosphoribosyltransferase
MTSFSFPVDKRAVAQQTARMMLDVEAIHFNAEKPFIFTSGWASPLYVDCRRLISFPRVRSALMDFAANTILTEIGFERIETIVGGETAGIPFAAWISDRLSLPMQYVRKKAKGFGRNAQIEGEVIPGAKSLLVEDLATDGRSKVNFCRALREAGLVVDHCFVIFYYDIFPHSRELMKELGVELHCLATWWDVIDIAKSSGRYDAGVLREIESFLHNPSSWSAAHGGIAEFGSEPAA